MNALSEALGSDSSMCLCGKAHLLHWQKTFVSTPALVQHVNSCLLSVAVIWRELGCVWLRHLRGVNTPSDDLACEWRAPDFLCPCALFSLSLSAYFSFSSSSFSSVPLWPDCLSVHLPRSSSTTYSPSLFLLSFCFPLALPLCYMLAPLFFQVVLQSILLLVYLPAPLSSLSPFQSVFSIKPPPLTPHSHLRIPPYTHPSRLRVVSRPAIQSTPPISVSISASFLCVRARLTHAHTHTLLFSPPSFSPPLGQL